jgi:hypothetical protein
MSTGHSRLQREDVDWTLETSKRGYRRRRLDTRDFKERISLKVVDRA